jgi:hypothetical protein
MSWRSDTKEITWSAVKKNSAFLTKKGNHIKFQFSSHPQNSRGLNSKKYNVFVAPTFSVATSTDGESPSVVVSTRTAAGKVTDTNVSTDFDAVVAAVKAVSIRADLQESVLAKWSKLSLSLKENTNVSRARTGKKSKSS